jgi:hypothetical protein
MKTIILRYSILITLLFATLYENSIGGFEYHGFIYCKSPTFCTHEQGHALDTRLGNPSQSDAFNTAVIDYANHALLNNNRNAIVDTIIAFPGVTLPMSNNGFATLVQGGWGGFSELYATIYQMVDGDIESIPDELQRFYEVRSW